MIPPLELTGLTKVFRHADRPVRRRQGRQRAGRSRASSSASSATRAAASRPCCRSSPAWSRRRSAASSSTAREVREPGRGARGRLPGAVSAAVADGARERRRWPLRQANAAREPRGRAPITTSSSSASPTPRDQLPGDALARHAAVRLAGARAVARAAVPAARRAVLAARLADALRAAGHAAARLGRDAADRRHGDARRRRGALPRRSADPDDRRSRGDRRRRAARAVSAAAHRAAVLEHPEYYACHRHVIDFLEHHAQQLRPSPLDDILAQRA